MKKSALLLAVGILSLAFGAKAEAQTKKIGMEKARALAMQKAAGKIESEELEKENGKTVYSFDIRNSQGTITEVQVEAFTGEIVSVEEEDAAKEAAEKRGEKNEQKEKNEIHRDKTRKMNEKNDDDESPAVKKQRMEKLSKDAKITLEQARAIALKRVPGTITEEDLEVEKGVLQYSFDIKVAGGKIFDVEIDAKSGNVLKAVEDKEDKDNDN